MSDTACLLAVLALNGLEGRTQLLIFLKVAIVDLNVSLIIY